MAKRFQFRLDPLLNIKSFKVKEAQENLLQIMGSRLRKEEEIEQHNIYYNSLFKSNKRNNIASDLQTLFYHKVFVEDKIKILGNEKEQLSEIEKLKRNLLSEAMKEEKILEKLKEKKMLIHNSDMLKEENKVLDEIAIKQHLHNK
jgi:flagellar protein FliJ